VLERVCVKPLKTETGVQWNSVGSVETISGSNKQKNESRGGGGQKAGVGGGGYDRWYVWGKDKNNFRWIWVKGSKGWLKDCEH